MPNIKARLRHPKLGLQVRVCGVKLDREGFVCSLPYDPPGEGAHSIHACLGLNDAGEIVIIYMRDPNEGAQWEVVEVAAEVEVRE